MRPRRKTSRAPLSAVVTILGCGSAWFAGCGRAELVGTSAPPDRGASNGGDSGPGGREAGSARSDASSGSGGAPSRRDAGRPSPSDAGKGGASDATADASCPASTGSGVVAWATLEQAANFARSALTAVGLPGGDAVFVGKDVARYTFDGSVVGRHSLPSDFLAVLSFSQLSDGLAIVLGTPELLAQGDAATSGMDLVVGQYTPGGKRDWLSGIRGTVLHAQADVSNGYASFGGSFQRDVTVGVGTGTETTFTSLGSTDVFVAGLAGGGGITWAHQVGSTNPEQFEDIVTCPDGSSVLLGYGYGDVILDPGLATEQTIAVPGEAPFGTDSFVVRYAQNGAYVWSTEVANTQGRAIAAAPDCGIAETGYFDDPAVFGYGTPNAVSFPSDATQKGFVARYDPVGGLKWATKLGGSGVSSGYAVSIGGDGSVFVAGTFAKTLELGDARCSATLISDFADGLFVARYDAGGQLVWARELGTEGGGASVTSLDATSDGGLLIVGTMPAPSRLHFPSEMPPPLEATSGSAAFLVKMWQ
jgi:hypothetical protein